jgi:hypothetical protein
MLLKSTEFCYQRLNYLITVEPGCGGSDPVKGFGVSYVTQRMTASVA